MFLYMYHTYRCENWKTVIQHFLQHICVLIVSRVFLSNPQPALVVWDVFEERFIFTLHSAYLIFTISSVIRLYYFAFFISCGFFSCYNEFLWCICIYWFGCVKSITTWKMLSPVVFSSVLSAVEVSNENYFMQRFCLFYVRLSHPQVTYSC